MSGGGGGGGPAPQDNSLQIAQMNAQKAKDDEAAQQAVTDQKRTAFGPALDTAMNQGKDRYVSTLQDRGIDPSSINIDSVLKSIVGRVPDLDPNPGQYFTDDAINNAITNTQDAKRSKFTNQVNSTFAPGAENSVFTDTSDDPYINEILSGQKADASRSIDFAKQRGQLTDLGYSGALDKLGTQETGARSTLDSLGSSVIAKDRANLGDVRSRAVQGADAFTLGGNDFDINPYLTDWNSAASTGQANLKGDITNALGGTKLFNVNDILLAGAGQQGPQNLTTTAGAGVTPKKAVTTDRGLGSGGAF